MKPLMKKIWVGVEHLGVEVEIEVEQLELGLELVGVGDVQPGWIKLGGVLGWGRGLDWGRVGVGDGVGG